MSADPEPPDPETRDPETPREVPDGVVSAPAEVSSAIPAEAGPPAVSAALHRAPLLAAVAAAAALADLAWNRVGLRLIDPAARDLWIPLVAPGRVLRNLGGLTALVAAGLAVSSLVGRAGAPRDDPWQRFPMRLALAGVAGLYLPGVALALVAPRERIPSLVVVLSLLSANALVALLGAYSIRYARVGSAWPALLAGLTAILAMTGLAVAQLRVFVPLVGTLGVLCRHGGELAWLSTPLVLVFDRDLRQRAARQRAVSGLAALGGAAVLGLGAWAQWAHGTASARVAYGAFRVAALPAEATVLYSLPLALAASVAILELASPARRQLGYGLALWIAAGLAPRTPGGTLYEALAALLFTRAARAAHPQGRRA